MSRENKVDLGFVQIHKKVIADIAVQALREIEGVELNTSGLLTTICELFGQKYYPNVIVAIDENNQVNVEMKVNVRYGVNISDMARQIQDVVRAAVEKSVDINLREVNVNIHGIERGI